MHDPIVANVVRRYQASHEPLTAASAQFTPPRGIVNAVEEGELPREVLNIWKYVADRLGDRFAFDSAVKYWRNKCARMGIELPPKFVKGLGGKGGAGRWSVSTGDQIEEWVKTNLKSEGLLDDLERSVYDWSLWVEHYEHAVEQALEKVDKHTKALQKVKSDKGAQQRLKWLNGAQKELAAQTDELEKAKKAMANLAKQAAKHKDSKSPTIEFEKEFQFLVLLAMKEFDKDQVRKAVDKALERVEEGLEIPGGGIDVSQYEGGFKSAGVFDWLGKAWDFLVNKFDDFVDWVSGILRIGNRFEAMMKAAG